MLPKILLACALFGATIPAAPAVMTDEPEQPPLTIEDRIRLAANQYEVDPEQMIKVMMCESGGNPSAINHGDAEITGKPSYGLFQFQPTTYRLWAAEIGEVRDIMDIDGQIRVTAYAFSKDRQWHWSCFNKLYRS